MQLQMLMEIVYIVQMKNQMKMMDVIDVEEKVIIQMNVMHVEMLMVTLFKTNNNLDS